MWLEAQVHWHLLHELAKCKTPFCIIDAYPYKGYWCNDAWASLWECQDQKSWKECVSKTMEGWSYSTHVAMQNLKNIVQVKKLNHQMTFNIFRNGTSKIITVYQRPFSWKGNILVLYELLPQVGNVMDNIRRSAEGFRHSQSLITLFTKKGNLIFQNTSSENFYTKGLVAEEMGKKNPSKSCFELIIGNNEVYQHAMDAVENKSFWTGYTLYCCRFTHAFIRRRISIAYGVDPVSRTNMIVLDESYSLEYDNELEKGRKLKAEGILVFSTSSGLRTAAQVEGSVFFRGNSDCKDSAAKGTDCLSSALLKELENGYDNISDSSVAYNSDCDEEAVFFDSGKSITDNSVSKKLAKVEALNEKYKERCKALEERCKHLALL